MWLSSGKQCGGSCWCCWHRAGKQKPAPVWSWSQLKTLHGQPPASARVPVPALPQLRCLDGGCVVLLPDSAWLMGVVWCVEPREEVQRHSQALWLSLFVPVPAVVPTWRCSHLPSASEEPFQLCTFIFTASVRHPSGSVLILPLQKIEIFISPSISEKLRFLSP